MNDMLITLLADLLTAHLNSAKLGVQVLGFAELDSDALTRVVTEVTERLQVPLYWCLPEITLASVPLGAEVATTIEQAVAWRNTPECAGHIVVIVADEFRLPKLHSLADFDLLTPASVRSALVQEMVRQGPTEVRLFWEALDDYAATVPLDDLLAYAEASRDEMGARQEVWRVGFLADDDLFLHPPQQMARHRAMLTETQRLSKPVHTRMLRVVASADTRQRARVQHTYQRLMDYVNSGRSEHLQDLQFEDVAWLVHTSKARTDLTSPTRLGLRDDVATTNPKPASQSATETCNEETFVMQLPTVLQAYRAQAWYYTGALHLVWCYSQNQSPNIDALLPYVASGLCTGLDVAIHSVGQPVTPLVLSSEVEAACERGALRLSEHHFTTMADWAFELQKTPPHLLIASTHDNKVLHLWSQSRLDATWFVMETFVPLQAHEMPQAILLAHNVTAKQAWYVWSGQCVRVSLALYKHAHRLHLSLDLTQIESALQTHGILSGNNGLTLIRAPYSAEGTKAARVTLQRLTDWLKSNKGSSPALFTGLWP